MLRSELYYAGRIILAAGSAIYLAFLTLAFAIALWIGHFTYTADWGAPIEAPLIGILAVGNAYFAVMYWREHN